MKKTLFMLLLIPLFSSAQEKGTRFEEGMSWEQVKAKAKKENKYLFVDCYTTWCGPCKYMANTIFPQEKVGDYFNTHFVSVGIQFDKTDKDSEHVKSYYPVAEELNKKYNIRAYPTFLVFAPSGEIVHRLVGGDEADNFIARTENALHPETQYYTLLKKYDEGDRSPEFLRRMALAAQGAYDQENANKISEAYLATQSNLYTKENLEFLGKFINSSNSKGFQLMLNEPEKVDAVLGKGKAGDLLAQVILQEEVYPYLRTPTANVDSLFTVAQAKYPKVDIGKQGDLLKLQVYQMRKDWDSFQPAVVAYMEKHGADVNPQMLNSFAWTVFENCEDPDCIAAALAWSKKSIDATNSKEPTFLDTYANLLYKMGRKDEAIAVEKNALALVSEGDKDQYQTTLDKMERGEETWRKSL
ncbi:thioredoxin fold domain-containing protein [Olivibacter sp. XZL3]|uniref:thioredoxin family protein n=1 Tax=Olivibacter sp. XZL3 TaxID=1735116 RepID=UPI001064AFC3|nr:thioredoxin fold domain-containing protein [Olivibacter sp. XZL3]